MNYIVICNGLIILMMSWIILTLIGICYMKLFDIIFDIKLYLLHWYDPKTKQLWIHKPKRHTKYFIFIISICIELCMIFMNINYTYFTYFVFCVVGIKLGFYVFIQNKKKTIPISIKKKEKKLKY
jgi:hypothetical protein